MTRQLPSRSQLLSRIQKRLERDGFPRLQMLFLVSLTGASGLLASYLLLQAGVGDMWLRYPLALCIAYLFFLTLLWLWLRSRASDYFDIPDLSGFTPSGRAGCKSEPFASGHGGDFGGGGASGSFDVPTSTDLVSSETTSAVGDALGSVGDADEGVIFIALIGVVLLVVGLAISSLYVVYSAPVLFAELLLDGVLAAGLYRRLRTFQSRHWLQSAIRHTLLPFICTAVFLATAGWVMQRYAPEAQSIGEVVQH